MMNNHEADWSIPCQNEEYHYPKEKRKRTALDNKIDE